MPRTDTDRRRLQEIVEKTELADDDVFLRTGDVYDTILLESALVEDPNFTRVAEADLARMFELYDEIFYDGSLGRLARSDGNTLSFRLSSRMTSAAGKTFQRRRRRKGPAQYEIAISTALLFAAFRGSDHRPITVSGVPCVDRLAAMQRVFEHETLHLVEMLIWDDSSCFRKRFRSMATRLFGHRESTHSLITPVEQAREQFGIKTGDLVTFSFEGRTLTGYVNRVTKRATILVPDPKGERYSDNRRYTKFYVPLSQLRRA
ncbi:hypothetical protein [Thalassoroseus pseudoceratinae]|uniref:hypothetical protein n=1 Tax=Thalassoroseus pseudoceratinae TaxID=2713176 RepID=UPI00197CC6E7|nr:hypothetical protein [Thalassoroseus pseudoceratinae]